MGHRRTSSCSASGRSRRLKRKYFGRKPAAAQVDDVGEVAEATADAEATEQSASTRKLGKKPEYLADESFDRSGSSDGSEDDDSEASDGSGEEVEEDFLQSNRIVYLRCLQELLDVATVCSKCKSGKINIVDCCAVGLASVVHVQCNNVLCRHSWRFNLCLKEKRFFDINRRSVLVMRRIGKGRAALNRFCGIMDMPSPVNSHAYTRHQEALVIAAATVASKSMVNAAEEVKILNGCDRVAVTCDGTWMRRGYSSLYGVFACISWRTGRVLDIHVSSKYCQECVLWSDRKESGRVSDAEFTAWKATHTCGVNTARSAPAMESEAAVILWKRSVADRGLLYTTYIGDGDSKAFNAVVDADPYDGVVIEKEECIGHVQKRIGAGLRELKRTTKGTKLSDGKALTGRGRLTDKTIDTLQTYYGWAVREHNQDIQGMAKAIWGGLMHRCSSDSNPQHQYCPTGPDSSCKWQLVQAGVSDHHYVHHNTLPKAVFDVIKPIYLRLTERKLLERCLLGATQNANESFHGVIWGMCQKETFCGADVVRFAASLAVANFNDGALAVENVLLEADCVPGLLTHKACQSEDLTRISEADRKVTAEEKEKRKKRRRKKGWEETTIEEEGVTYDAGMF